MKSESGERWRDFDQSKVYLKDIESSILQLLFYDVKIFPIDSTKLDHLKTIVQFLSERYPKTRFTLWKYFCVFQPEYLVQIFKYRSNIFPKKLLLLMKSRNVKTGFKFLPKLVLRAFKAKIQLLNMLLVHQGKWTIWYWILTRDYSIPNHRGYTCSLWTLFHYLLANFDDSSSYQAAGVIHAIVTDFFWWLRWNFFSLPFQSLLSMITNQVFYGFGLFIILVC